MVTWQSQPQQQVIVTHAGGPFTLLGMNLVVRRHENGFDTGTVLLEDIEAGNYQFKVVAGDPVEIQQKDLSDGAWTTILKGVIRRAEPLRSSHNLLNVECDGAGYGLNMTKCAEEYGTESTHTSLDTIREMVKDASYGIIPKYTNCLLGSATATGYSYTTYVEAIAGSIKYMYFPYKPCDKAINDICDIVQAIKGTNAGPHWIVDTSGRFLLTTVGAHSAAGDNPAQYWPTWWRTDQAGSTLVEGVDFLNFRFQQLAKEANYVLLAGSLRKPGNGDVWTENNSGDWGHGLTGAGGCDCTMSDENGAGLFKVGSYSIEAFGDVAGGLFEFYYPSSKDLSLDITKIGGEYNIPTISFWCQFDSNVENNDIGDLQILLLKYVDAADIRYFRTCFGGWDEPVSGNFHAYIGEDEWYHITLPIGPYAQSAQKDFEDWIAGNLAGAGAMSWSDVDAIFFFVQSKAGQRGKIYIDGLTINGYVLRGARQVAAFTSASPLKMKMITDSIGKDDSLIASNDSGTIAELCYAEYLRQSSTPIVGTFKTRIANDILPGQLVHLHAKKKSTGEFRIDDDFRVTRVIHNINNQGFFTVWDVTDDLKNANPRPMPTQLNTLLAAVRPEFQDRQATSIKAREIDITQDILVKTY